MAKRKTTYNLYYIHFYRNGFCYRTAHSAKWEDVLREKKLAKKFGETIEYELQEKIIVEY